MTGSGRQEPLAITQQRRAGFATAPCDGSALHPPRLTLHDAQSFALAQRRRLPRTEAVLDELEARAEAAGADASPPDDADDDGFGPPRIRVRSAAELRSSLEAVRASREIRTSTLERVAERLAPDESAAPAEEPPRQRVVKPPHERRPARAPVSDNSFEARRERDLDDYRDKRMGQRDWQEIFCTEPDVV